MDGDFDPLPSLGHDPWPETETPVTTIKPAPPENPTDNDLRTVQVELAKALVALEWSVGTPQERVRRSTGTSACDAVYHTPNGFEIGFYSNATKCKVVGPDHEVVTIGYGFSPWEILEQKHHEIESAEEERERQQRRTTDYATTTKLLDMIRGDR